MEAFIAILYGESNTTKAYSIHSVL